MNKFIRIIFVVGFLAAIIAFGLQGTAWANKLSTGNQAPIAIGLKQVLPVGARPLGTVITVPPIIPITGGQVITVGSCATVMIQSVPSGVQYTGQSVDQTQMSQPFPGNLVSCGVKIVANPSTNLGAETQVCFPIPPGQAGFAYYWDGTNWVKTSLPASNGQSCVIIPANAPNPVFAALFDK